MEKLKKSVGVIDCFGITPEINSYNWMVDFLPFKLYYHHAGQHGIDTLEFFNHDAYILLGSMSHVTENLDWHKKLVDFILSKLELNIPMIGFCFSHQLIAHYFGSKVDYNEEDHSKFTGIVEIELTENFSKKLNLKNKKLNLLASHAQQIKNLSSDFIIQGTRENNPFDIIEHKKYKLILSQAHPEAFMKTKEKIEQYGLEACLKVMDDGKSFIKNSLDYLLGEF